jgi:hypothetical protein
MVTTDWKGGVGVFVDGKPAASSGRDRWRLPAVKGPDREAMMEIKFWQVFPLLTVDSTEYRTGPKTPIWLIVLAALPLAVVITSWYGIFFGVATALLNQQALRDSTNPVIRVARIVIQNVIGLGFFLALNGN